MVVSKAKRVRIHHLNPEQAEMVNSLLGTSPYLFFRPPLPSTPSSSPPFPPRYRKFSFPTVFFTHSLCLPHILCCGPHLDAIHLPFAASLDDPHSQFASNGLWLFERTKSVQLVCADRLQVREERTWGEGKKEKKKTFSRGSLPRMDRCSNPDILVASAPRSLSWMKRVVTR